MHPFRGRGSCARGRAHHHPQHQPAFGRDNSERGINLGPRGHDRGRGNRGGSGRGARGSGGVIIQGGLMGRAGQNRMEEGGNNGRYAERRADGFRGRERQEGEGRRDNTPKDMTYGRLKGWAEMEDAGELVLFMSSQKQQIETFLNQPVIKADWVELLVKAVSHAIAAQHQKESIKQLLNTLCRTRFFEHFSVFIEEKQLLQDSWKVEEFFRSLINIMEEILVKLPQYSMKCITGASCLSNATPSLESIPDSKPLLDTITSFLKRAKEIYVAEKEKEKQTRGRKFTGSNDSEKPPDNFIDLPVVPEESDLLENAKPFLRQAKVKGEYDDVEHYLDVQFRLMRQDFVFPLREGIIDFKKNGHKKDYRSSDLRMYNDVHIVGIVFKDGIDHILQFDISKLRNVKWDLSKRLIFGSLLCLSKDNFATCLFATVSNRDSKNLAKGIVNVNFRTGLDVVFNSTSNDHFIMAETTAYFESYCHVLEGLKEMTKALPLQDYIIYCKKMLKPPRYLLPAQGVPIVPMYNLSPLMQKSVPMEVAVLTTVSWPSVDIMCLNKSQREAAILALTKELAVIQGPPGTGKTYVGLKVMQVLIENMHVISGKEEESSPILVVCYTNHALDQFLEGVLEFCPDGIVRVGGKNNSQKLEQFNIKNLKQKLRKEKLFSNLSVRRSMYECLKELEEVTFQIQDQNRVMNSLEIDVLSENALKEHMNSAHYSSLTLNYVQTGKSKNHMRNWLNASIHTPKEMLPRMIQKHLANLVLKLNIATFDLSLTADMTITQRAVLYHSYLALYRDSLMQRLQYLASMSMMTSSESHQIRQLLILTEKEILSDEELVEIVPYPVMENILSFIGSAPSGKIFETWLLGLHTDLHSQLDDVQTLTNLLSGEMADVDTFDDEEASQQAQNDRMIDDDDDEFSVKNYGAKNKAAMNDLASVLQRADMLGIKEDMLTEPDNEQGNEWKTVSHTKPLTFLKLQQKLKSVKPMTEDMEKTIGNIWDLKLDQRFALYNLWVKRYKDTLVDKMKELVAQYTSALERRKEINREEILFILRSAKVIGMTTTGAAKHRAVLQSVGCRIIVVEEAAEVLESHIVTSLNKNCKHLILIGDHQQLRPSPTVYLLAKEYGLEISLFERLINNKVPHVVLKEQHRMRPDISKIMYHIYPDLQDHASVKVYDNIRGVTKNIFFIQHEQKETKVADSRSKANMYEAEFLVALCQYFLNQGYKETEITILATYAGQVFAIKKIMKDIKFSHRVRVTAVDNFQGEENNIILLSLVRSNEDESVGFLKVDNRVCVALSRAKKGLFVTGNFDLLASQSKLWKTIVETATLEQFIGGGLPVVCENHPDFQQVMTCAEDFKNCPDGGCGRPCDYRLTCGHVCQRKCHGYDLEHQDCQCRKSCAKMCVNGHRCQKKCYQDCGNCMVKVPKRIPVCGHVADVPCSISETKAECSESCTAMLNCEHQCSGKCGQCRKNNKHEKCSAQVEYYWPCGHNALVPCFMHPSEYPCQKVCGVLLECGHKCVGKCSDCLEGSVHVACGKKCDLQLPCGHKCSSYCGVPCMPCTEVCPAQCAHSACDKSKPKSSCSHPCPSCKENCRHVCQHAKCKQLCSEICDMVLCTKSCSKKVVNKCGHDCSGLCGELCVCAECEKVTPLPMWSNPGEEVLAQDGDEKEIPDEVEPKGVENQAKTTENKVKKHKRRLIIKLPSCFHIFYVDELDNYVKSYDPDGCKYIFCPVCPKPILKCMRYETPNKLRHSKRELEKAKLKMLTDVSKKQKTNLLMSQKKIEDSVFLSGFHSMDVVEVKNQAELQTMSFKLKCAFILSEISSFKDESDSSFIQILKSRKNAVLHIRRLTNQQKLEFRTELLRCFWLSYLTHLQKLGKLYDIDVPEATNNLIKVTKQNLSKLKLEKVTLDRALHVSDILRFRIKEMSVHETVKARCLLLEQTSSRVVKIMESQDEDMLSDLLSEGSSKSSVSKTFGLRFQGAAQAAAEHQQRQVPYRALDKIRSGAVTRVPAAQLSQRHFKKEFQPASKDPQGEIFDVVAALQQVKVSRNISTQNYTDSDSDSFSD